MKEWSGLSGGVEEQLGVGLMRSDGRVLGLGVRGVRCWWSFAVHQVVREKKGLQDLVLGPCVRT
jgi:hypothetical protein